MQLGLVTYNIAKDWDLPTIIERCPRLGFEGVELRTTHAHGVEDTLSSGQRADVRRRFSDSAVELVGLGTIFEYHALDPAVVRENVEGTKRYAQLAADVGASGIKVRPNGHQEEAGVPREQTLEQIGDALRECGPAAADCGIDIRLEMHGTVADARDIRRIMDTADHPSVRVCWNSNPVDVKDGSVARDFALMRDLITLVHIHDLTDEGYPWAELFSLLRERSYDGFCLAEIQESGDPERVLTYFRSLFHAYGG
ncbi:MAG: xylose isomerase [Dehalococcoidia bacterium]|nr:xylose isomerase [Dehalococcoidia bacterium]